jgi:hypothetical protein
MKAKTPPTAEKRKGPAPYGKRSDPAYGQHNVYLPKALFGKVTRKLVNSDGSREEFSGLVESLLRAWLKAKSGNPVPKQERKSHATMG